MSDQSLAHAPSTGMLGRITPLVKIAVLAVTVIGVGHSDTDSTPRAGRGLALSVRAAHTTVQDALQVAQSSHLCMKQSAYIDASC